MSSTFNLQYNFWNIECANVPTLSSLKLQTYLLIETLSKSSKFSYSQYLTFTLLHKKILLLFLYFSSVSQFVFSELSITTYEYYCLFTIQLLKHKVYRGSHSKLIETLVKSFKFFYTQYLTNTLLHKNLLLLFL